MGRAEEEQPLAAPEELAAQKREQRLRKFRELHLKRNEARKLNHQEVVEEDKRLKLPANWEAKKARLEWELQEEEKKKVRIYSAVFISDPSCFTVVLRQ